MIPYDKCFAVENWHVNQKNKTVLNGSEMRTRSPAVARIADRTAWQHAFLRGGSRDHFISHFDHVIVSFRSLFFLLICLAARVRLVSRL